MAVRNKVKSDTILKNFWKDNERFADLFNASLFQGKNVIRSEDLTEVDTEVDTVFNIIRFIYNKEYDKMNEIYKEQTISPELAIVIGAITETQKMIDDALRLEKEGGTMNMCKALEELEEKGRLEGREEGKVEGAIAVYKTGYIKKYSR